VIPESLEGGEMRVKILETNERLGVKENPELLQTTNDPAPG